MKTILLCFVLLLVLFAAAAYLWRSKKRGSGCIGCPHGDTCTKSGHAACREKQQGK